MTEKYNLHINSLKQHLEKLKKDENINESEYYYLKDYFKKIESPSVLTMNDAFPSESNDNIDYSKDFGIYVGKDSFYKNNIKTSKILTFRLKNQNNQYLVYSKDVDKKILIVPENTLLDNAKHNSNSVIKIERIKNNEGKITNHFYLKFNILNRTDTYFTLGENDRLKIQKLDKIKSLWKFVESNNLYSIESVFKPNYYIDTSPLFILSFGKTETSKWIIEPYEEIINNNISEIVDFSNEDEDTKNTIDSLNRNINVRYNTVNLKNNVILKKNIRNNINFENPRLKNTSISSDYLRNNLNKYNLDKDVIDNNKKEKQKLINTKSDIIKKINENEMNINKNLKIINLKNIEIDKLNKRKEIEIKNCNKFNKIKIFKLVSEKCIEKKTNVINTNINVMIQQINKLEDKNKYLSKDIKKLKREENKTNTKLLDIERKMNENLKMLNEKNKILEGFSDFNSLINKVKNKYEEVNNNKLDNLKSRNETKMKNLELEENLFKRKIYNQDYNVEKDMNKLDEINEEKKNEFKINYNLNREMLNNISSYNVMLTELNNEEKHLKHKTNNLKKNHLILEDAYNSMKSDVKKYRIYCYLLIATIIIFILLIISNIVVY